MGAPLRCNEVKLADVPEMNYTNADSPYPRGEVCCNVALCFVLPFSKSFSGAVRWPGMR